MTALIQRIRTEPRPYLESEGDLDELVGIVQVIRRLLESMSSLPALPDPDCSDADMARNNLRLAGQHVCLVEQYLALAIHYRTAAVGDALLNTPDEAT